MADKSPRVAVACQGGGSHTAFTAGVLKRLLADERFQFVAFTGTSGGAIDALLAWYGLLADGREKAGLRLEAFWEEIAANSLPDFLLNAWALAVYRALSPVVAPEISPYLYPPWATDRLRQVVTAHVDFERFGELVALAGAATPALLVGAVEVCSGEFKVFRNAWMADGAVPVLEVTPEAILASAAIPTLFRAAHVDGHVYWDGLFSENPPVRQLTDLQPDEIWVVKINPTRRSSEPTSMADIRDRRNELAGNLSLDQELYFIEKINDLMAGDRKGNKLAPGYTYRPIKLHTIEMDVGHDLDTESKLDRSPSFIGSLFETGEGQAGAFLAGWRP